VRRIPLLYFGLALLLGIITDATYSIGPLTCMAMLASLWCLYLLIHFRTKTINRNNPAVKTLIVFLLVYITGITSNTLRSSFRNKTSDPTGEILLVKIDSESSNRNDKKTFLSTIHCWEKNEWSKPLQAYVYADSIALIKEGTILLTLNTITRIKSTSNPGEFDFSKFAAYNDIHHTLKIRNNRDHIIIQIPEKEKRRYLQILRNKILNIIRKHFDEKSEAGLAEAILLGYRKELDQELIQNYLDTGVIHVIAISGMHLGLIFGLIDLLIKLIADKKRSKWAAVLISLPMLWIFTLLTGGSASVLRSAIMFSFMIIGTLLNRRNNGLNGLAGAGLLLLFYDPDYWMDLGFQLSFTAVLSIILFNKRILSCLYFRNPILKLLWNLLAVTIAAQILTTPLVIYHFHRFPTLFLFTNMIAVPLSSVLLLLEILLCIFHFCSFLSGPIVVLIKNCMYAMNGYISLMAKVPFGMINDIHVSLTMICLITLIFLSISQLFLNPSKWIWRIIIVLNLTAASVSLKEKIKLRQLKRIQILNVFQGTVILHQHGKEGEIWVSENFNSDPSVINRISGICRKYGIRFIKWSRFPLVPLLISDKRHFSLLHKVNPSAARKITHKSTLKMTWITDGSTSMWKSREWQKAMQKLHLRFHSTRDEGPYTISCADSSQKR
jgi:competence protein ComEC